MRMMLAHPAVDFATIAASSLIRSREGQLKVLMYVDQAGVVAEGSCS